MSETQCCARFQLKECLFEFSQLEKSEPKRKSKKKQVYVPVYLDLPEVHIHIFRVFFYHFTIIMQPSCICVPLLHMHACT
jgi:hypothetical protein